MVDSETIRIEDSFKGAAVCLRIIWGLILVAVVFGFLYGIYTFPFPKNLYSTLIIIPCVITLYLIFRKLIKMSKEARGFQISDDKIEIKVPSKPLTIIPWRGLVHIKVIKIDGDDYTTYRVIFEDKLDTQTIHLRSRDFHIKKIRLFVQRLSEVASKKYISFSIVRKTIGLFKTTEEEVDFI